LNLYVASIYLKCWQTQGITLFTSRY